MVKKLLAIVLIMTFATFSLVSCKDDTIPMDDESSSVGDENGSGGKVPTTDLPLDEFD